METESVKNVQVINNQADMEKFRRSLAYQILVGFISHANDTIKGKSKRGTYVVTPVGLFYETTLLRLLQIVERMLNVLDQLMQWVKDIPPDKQVTRYGNKVKMRSIYIHSSLCRRSEFGWQR